MPARTLVATVTACAVMAGGPGPGVNAAESATAASGSLSTCSSTDNGDPLLTDFRVDARTVDVRSGDGVLGLTVTAQDLGGPGPATGVRSVRVIWSSGASSLGTWLRYETDQQTWSGSVTFPPGVPAGTWRPTVMLADAGYGATSYDADLLRDLGYPHDLTLISDPDVTGPVLVGLRLSTSSVDTRRRSRTLALRVRARDDMSGLRTVQVRASGGSRARSAVGQLHIATGTRARGVWLGALVVPRWAGNGPWSLTLRLEDRVGRVVRHRPADLRAMGLPYAVDVISRADAVVPAMAAPRLSPTTLDVRDGDGTMGITVRVRDAGSGVSRARARLLTRFEGYGVAGWARLRLVSGTRRDGVWGGSLSIRRCADWRLSTHAPSGRVEAVPLISAVDRARNVNTSEWPTQAAHFFFRDNVWPGTEAATGPEGALTVAFTEPVVANGRWDPLVQRRDSEADVAGTWSCFGPYSVVVSCATDAVVRATFHPTAVPEAGTRYDVRINRSGRLDVMDLAGNPVVGWA